MYDTSEFPVEDMKEAPNSMHEQLEQEADLDAFFAKLKPVTGFNDEDDIPF